MIAASSTLHIAGVVRSPQLQYELGEATAGLVGIKLDLRVGELGSAGRQLLGSEASPDALLLDVDVDDARDMAVLARLAEQAGRASIPVVATARELGPAAMRRLLRDGVTDLVAQPIDRADVVQMVRAVSRRARRAQATKSARGRLLTFSRATGGAGATTLAVNLAHALARSREHHRAKVCLIDLDLEFGAVALQLDLEPTTVLLEIAQAPELPDTALLARSLLEHPSGLRVLTAPIAPLPLDALKPDVVASLLELARTSFDYVIVDLPVALTAWTGTVLGQSDLVCLVTQLNVPAVRQLRRLLDVTEEVGLYNLPVQLVLNRLQGSFGWGTGLKRRAAEKALGRQFDHCIADQFNLLITAANRGMPALDARRYSRFGREVRALLRQSLRQLAARPALAAAH